MTWALFYLVCFLVGVTLSVLSFIGGSWHLPHFHVHLPHGHVPHAHVPHGGGHPAGGGHGAEMPFVNFATVTAFLAWFGGSGFLLTRYSMLTVTAVMLIAIGCGLVGSTVIFWFVAKLLMKHDRELDPADYDRIGVLGRISSPIRQGGTGEMIFSQQGTRHTCGARSDTGEAMERGVEVIIMRYERGIAYVRKYEDMADGKASSGL